jgi:hypothetical protein
MAFFSKSFHFSHAQGGGFFLGWSLSLRRGKKQEHPIAVRAADWRLEVTRRSGRKLLLRS